jgi:hypothetical protein
MFATDAPFTSPLEPSWVGFTLEETALLKGNTRNVKFVLSVIAIVALSYP